MKDITVVVVNREQESPYLTLRTLATQTVPLDFVIVFDKGRGANWGRNQGALQVRTKFVLFSDNDIEWENDALENLYRTLTTTPQASYSYGWYEMENKEYCKQEFDPGLLRSRSYISTMSLLRLSDFPGFDELVPRLQDWDLWLTLLAQNKTGVYCGKRIFRTQKRNGITFNGNVSWEEANSFIVKKHGLR